MGDSMPGLQARLMSQALRKLTASINRSNTMVIFINQIRMKIGVMYGSPETTTGGHALKFYASVRLDIRRIGAIKDRDEVVGNQTRVKVVKNKLAPPFKQVEFDIMYGEGVSKNGELVDLGVKAGVVEKSGAWFSYDSQRIGQGRENAKTFLKNNPDIAAKIEVAIRQNAGLIAEKILAGENRRSGRRRRRGGVRLRRRKGGGLSAGAHVQSINRRHARPCAGHPRLWGHAAKTWMAGTSPAMTVVRAQTATSPDSYLRLGVTNCAVRRSTSPSTRRRSRSRCRHCRKAGRSRRHGCRRG